MDEQDRQDTGLKYGDITQAVIGCAFEVINELGAGFLESVYEKALAIALRQKGLAVATQQPINVMFRGLLINFGNPKLEYKRFTRSKNYEHG